MKLTLNIKEQSKIASFLNLIKDMDYIEIINVNEDSQDTLDSHKELLDERLKQIENGETTFKKWDSVKRKYESKTL